MLNNNSIAAPAAQDGQPWATRVRLTANPLVNTAGLVRWAMIGFQAEQKRGGHLATFLAVLADGYGLGLELAARVLRKEIVTLFEGEEVVLLLDAENTRIYQHARAAAEPTQPSIDLPIDIPVGEQPEAAAEHLKCFCNEGARISKP